LIGDALVGREGNRYVKLGNGGEVVARSRYDKDVGACVMKINLNFSEILW